MVSPTANMADDTLQSRSTDPCAACGLCCRSYLVPVFGQDVYRLVKQRGLDPRAFLFICEQETPDPVGFLLDANGPAYGLALDKKNALEANQPCVFLIENADGTSRCGVYEDRPIACIAYPMVRAPSGVAFLPGALCPPNAWTPDEPVNEHWAASLRRLARYRDTYIEVVRRWNAWVASTPSRARPAEHFLAYVLQTYDRLAKLDADIAEDKLMALERTWGTLNRSAPREGGTAEEPGWMTYFRRARAVIDEFFPELPPVPFARLSVEVEPGSH